MQVHKLTKEYFSKNKLLAKKLSKEISFFIFGKNA